MGFWPAMSAFEALEEAGTCSRLAGADPAGVGGVRGQGGVPSSASPRSTSQSRTRFLTLQSMHTPISVASFTVQPSGMDKAFLSMEHRLRVSADGSLAPRLLKPLPAVNG